MFSSIGWPEIVIVGILGVLLFGKRLPDVARYVGQSLTQFRKGISEVKDEVIKGATAPLDVAAAPQNSPAPDAAPPVDGA
jgi:sec-independent protein translocase protein TatA